MAELFPCGTYAAYQRHRRKGEAICSACNEANNARSREQRKDPSVMREHVARSNARTRALWRLSREYPERYRELATEELAKLTFPEG